jgi:hypothetical protein
MKRALLLISIASAAACGPSIDLSKDIVLTPVASGWADGGTVAGKNRIVPAMTFRLTNRSHQPIDTVQVNAVFKRGTDPTEWTTGYVPNASRQLAPGADTGPLIAKGLQGYTGTDARDALLHHSLFVDAKVELFVKSGSSRWTRIGEFPIARQLIGQPPAPQSRTSAGARRDRGSAT